MGHEQTLHVCMGSACHQLQSHRLVPLLEAEIRRLGLDGRVALKGAFCLDQCQRGRSVRFGGRVYAGIGDADVPAFVRAEIAPALKRDSHGS